MSSLMDIKECFPLIERYNQLFYRFFQGSKRKSVRSNLHVSGDGLKVVDDDTKGLIVDQTIEKVSFCAPDRNYERGFSYICRDGTTRRWMCHGFIAIKESVSVCPLNLVTLSKKLYLNRYFKSY